MNKKQCLNCLYCHKVTNILEIKGGTGYFVTKVKCYAHSVPTYNDIDYRCGEYRCGLSIKEEVVLPPPNKTEIVGII